jgi:hypothetical protein
VLATYAISSSSFIAASTCLEHTASFIISGLY